MYSHERMGPKVHLITKFFDFNMDSTKYDRTELFSPNHLR